MNEKINKNAKVEKFANMLGIALRLIVIDPSFTSVKIFYTTPGYITLNTSAKKNFK